MWNGPYLRNTGCPHYSQAQDWQIWIPTSSKSQRASSAIRMPFKEKISITSDLLKKMEVTFLPLTIILRPSKAMGSCEWPLLGSEEPPEVLRGSKTVHFFIHWGSWNWIPAVNESPPVGTLFCLSLLKQHLEQIVYWVSRNIEPHN